MVLNGCAIYGWVVLTLGYSYDSIGQSC